MASNEVLPNLYVSAETLKACALIGLHLLAADYEMGSSGGQSPDLGDMWKYGRPKEARFGAARVRQVSPLVMMKSVGTTTSARPSKSLGRIGDIGVQLLHWTRLVAAGRLLGSALSGTCVAGGGKEEGQDKTREDKREERRRKTREDERRGDQDKRREERREKREETRLRCVSRLIDLTHPPPTIYDSQHDNHQNVHDSTW